MLSRERLEELKLLRLPQTLRGVFIPVCKHCHRGKGCGTKGLINIREQQNKKQRLKLPKLA